MVYKVLFLQEAEHDLKAIKKYLLKDFSKKSWEDCYQKIKQSIETIRTFPQLGHVPDELEALNLMHHRQVVSGKNRIIYEINEQLIYIHLICDARKSLGLLLMQRLTRMV